MTPIHPGPNAAVVAKAPILVLSSDCVAYQHLEPCLFESVADRRLFVARCPADAELAELEPVRGDVEGIPAEAQEHRDGEGLRRPVVAVGAARL